MSVWFVTGASRGLGAEITREALDRGHSVIATARDASAVLLAYPGKPDGLLAVNADVTEPEQLAAAVEAGLAKFGQIDVVVNNAGYGLVGAIEEVSDEAARALFDVNVFGALNTLRATLPTLRAQRSGHVLNIGSVGGFATAPGVGLYGASKFALEGISEALHSELAPLDVRVTIVEPGASVPTSSTAPACGSNRPPSRTTRQVRGRCARRWPTATAVSREIQRRGQKPSSTSPRSPSLRCACNWARTRSSALKRSST